MTELTRALIHTVAAEEATAACADLSDVLGMGIGRQAMAARRRAFTRLMRETDCTPTELARLWGCDPAVVFRSRHIETPPQSVYDQTTALRLRSCHGPDRAASIINGRDPATLADLAAWRGLGAKAEA